MFYLSTNVKNKITLSLRQAKCRVRDETPLTEDVGYNIVLPSQSSQTDEAMIDEYGEIQE